MGTPDKSAAPTIEQQVNTLVGQYVKGDDGKLNLPDDIEASDELQYAAKAEIRRRDTYSSMSKTNNENKLLQAENAALEEGWEADAITKLTSTQRKDLDKLKGTDPDAWRAKIDEYTSTARTEHVENRKKVTKKARTETELDKRVRLIEEHNKANPKMQLTDDVIQNDVPPRITDKLANGESTFEEYLAAVIKYLGKGKTITKGKSAEEEPDFQKAGGGSKPNEADIEAGAKDTYEKEIF